MYYYKILIISLITIATLSQNNPQAQTHHPQPAVQAVEPNVQPAIVVPDSIQPIVVQPLASQHTKAHQVPVNVDSVQQEVVAIPPLPNVVQAQPIPQAGVNTVQSQTLTQTNNHQNKVTNSQTAPQNHHQTVQPNVQNTAQPIQLPQPVPVQINNQQVEVNSQAQAQANQQQPSVEQQSNQNAQQYNRNVAYQQHHENPQVNQPSRSQAQSDAQRSAKYKAQQQRLNQIRRKQRQQQQRRARQMGVGPDPQAQLDRQRNNRNALQRNKQRVALHEIIQMQQQQGQVIPKKTVLFQINRTIEQYIISPTADVQITLKMLIYVLDNNAYSYIKDIDSAKALKVYVYEDNTRIVAQAQFYYQTAVKFSGKGKSNYYIRFYNDGILKLVSLTYPNILQALHFQNLYSSQKGMQQMQKTHFMAARTEQMLERLRRNSLMDRLNNDTMMQLLRKYSGYQFVEMLVVIVVSALQIHMIKKMFKSDSIL